MEMIETNDMLRYLVQTPGSTNYKVDTMEQLQASLQ